MSAAQERARIVAEVTARRDRAAKHRHAPYGDGCDDCGREKAYDDLLDWLTESDAAHECAFCSAPIPASAHIPHSTAELPTEDACPPPT